MDTQNSSVADVPNLKLAKVGKDRDKKRGGAGWLSGARGAGSAFSGAAGGAGAGAGGGIFGTGMSLAKLLTILLVSGGVSAGAWQVGNMMAASSSNAGPAAPKVFDSKDGPQKYADTSGVIKGGDRSIPNSLGYVNNDGLTDEQRAAKKAAEAAAAEKAAADAKAKADADAKAQALADAKAAAATPPAAPANAGAQVPKLGLGAGRFGGMKSSFGGGGGLSGGAGLSGGINRNFGAMQGLGGGKGQAGALTAFRSPSKAATTRASTTPRGKSNSKGFAKQQLDNANGMSRTALASGKTETASAGAATPFDNNPSQGSVISGPGVGNGAQTGPADSGGTNNPSQNYGGPIGNGAACQDANFEPDINGNCVSQTPNPTGQNAAPYQGLLDAIMVMLGIVMILSIIAMSVKNVPPYGTGIAMYLCGLACALGVVIAGMGVSIATMKHGDFMIGGIVAVVGGFIATAAAVSFGHDTSSIPSVLQPAGVLIASAVGELAAMSGKSKQASMQ